MKFRTLTLISVIGLVPAQAFAWPWSTDMVNQPSIKPQEGRPAAFPQRSVPVMGIPTTIKDREEARNLKNPMAATPASLKQGRTLFRIYCAACHGLSGKGDAPAGQKLGAIDLTSDYAQKDLSEGWIWGTITFGSAIMPAYGKPAEGGGSNDLSVEERWHVVNYVKNQLVKEPVASTTASASNP